MDEVTFPIRVLAAFGIQAVVLTNAAGAINSRYRPGDFMIVTDHLNFMGQNPLRGAPVATGFVDLSETYDSRLNRLFRKAARQAGLRLRSGIYVAVSGPSYETPAEIKAFARLGADAVGMSTVPEAIVAKQCGLRVAALSCLTNQAAGLNPSTISHAEVLAAGRRMQGEAVKLLARFVQLAKDVLRPAEV
jgi:purine-nucleoside phosphorylase